MNTGLLLSLCIASLCRLTSGCFSYASYQSFKEVSPSKKFHPIALYKGSDGGLAVEGSWKEERKSTDQSDHVYLLVAAPVVQQARLEKGGEVSFSDMRSSPQRCSIG
jgi:hypothetical protein